MKLVSYKLLFVVMLTSFTDQKITAMKSFLFYQKIILGFCVFFGVSLNLLCQDQLNYMIHPLFPMPATLILSTGDTIEGKIKQGTKLTDWYMSEVKYTGQGGEKIRFNASSVVKFAVEMNTYSGIGQPTGSSLMFFESRPSPKSGKMVFMYRYDKGRIKVFHNPRSSGSKNEWTHSGGKMTGIHFTYSPGEGLVIGPAFTTTTYIKIWHHSYYIEKDGGELIKISKKNIDALWPSLFGGCQEISKEIELNPDLMKWKNFLLLVRIYNEICE